jgi:hypothetical protein
VYPASVRFTSVELVTLMKSESNRPRLTSTAGSVHDPLISCEYTLYAQCFFLVDTATITGAGYPMLSWLRVSEIHLLRTLGAVGDDDFGLAGVERTDDRLCYILRAVRRQATGSRGHAPGA